MKESFEASGRHKRFDYLWSQNGLRMSQISMFQLTLCKTDSERQLHTSSCVVAVTNVLTTCGAKTDSV